jgi:hypothetical protein
MDKIAGCNQVMLIRDPALVLFQVVFIFLFNYLRSDEYLLDIKICVILTRYNQCRKRCYSM